MLIFGNKWLNRAIKKNVLITIAAMIFRAIAAASWVVTSYSLSSLLDGYYAGPAAFNKAALKVIALILLMMLLNYISDWVRAVYIRRVNNDVRKRISDSVIENTSDLLSSKNTGKKISWYLNDVDELENKYFTNICGGAYDVTMIILAFVAIVMLHWLFAVAAAVLFLISLLVPAFVNKFVMQAQEKLTVSKEEYTESVRDNLESVYTLFFADKLAYFMKRMTNAAQLREKKYYQYNMTRAKTQSAMFFVNFASQAGLMIFALYIASLGYVAPGSVLSIGALSGNLFNGVQGLMEALAVISSVSAITDKYAIKDTDENNVLHGGIEKIELKNVDFNYGEHSILKNFNYKFGKNKYALRGESGSGKSTLMKLMLGINQASGGTVTVNDIDIKDLDLKSYFRHLSYIEQNVYLLNETIRENILLGSNIPEDKLQKIIQITNLDKFVAGLPAGLDTEISSNGQQISGGEKQRIAIARALVKDVDFLFVDEATSQLDPVNRADIEKILLDLKNVGVVMISHNFDTATLAKFDAVIEM